MKKILLSLILLIPAITFAQYKPMNQPYQFNSKTKFADTVFLDTAMAGQGTYLVLDTLTGEVKRDTVPAAGENGIYGGSGTTPSSLVEVTNNGGVFFLDSASTSEGVTIHTDETNPLNNIRQGIRFDRSGAFTEMGFLGSGSVPFTIKNNSSGGGSSGIKLDVSGAGELEFAGNSVSMFINASTSGLFNNESYFSDQRSGANKKGILYEGFGESGSSGLGGNYSSLIDPSLAPVGYVKSIVSDSLSSFTLQSVTDNGATTDNLVTFDTTASYGAGMSGFTFSGNQIPNANWVETVTLQTDTFVYTSAEIIAMGTTADTFLTTVDSTTYVDVIGVTFVCVGGTPYSFTSGSVSVYSKDGIICGADATVLTSSSLEIRKASWGESPKLGSKVALKFDNTAPTAGNRVLKVVIHYKVIKVV